jgi:hypothetical protein
MNDNITKYEGVDSAKITQSSGLNPISLSAWTFVPKTRSILRITPDFHLYQTRPKPNRWIRFWQRVLLGWTWNDAP